MKFFCGDGDQNIESVADGENTWGWCGGEENSSFGWGEFILPHHCLAVDR